VNTYPGFSSWCERFYLTWHRNVRVSKKESDRNNEVEKHQKNRNPFIDYPELAEYIWGDKKGQPWNLSSGLSDITVAFSIKENPARDLLTVETKEAALSYAIYNVSGQRLLSGNIDGATNQIVVSTLAGGLYLIKMQCGMKKAVQKFMVAK
ncbi:MAG: endonuclease, partial [Prevotellaceae bacterium]|nr:endonuclease [Prevotellaceae bacterium]